MSPSSSYFPVRGMFHRDFKSALAPSSSYRPSHRRLYLVSAVSIVILTFVLFSPSTYTLHTSASAAASAAGSGAPLAARRAPEPAPAARAIPDAAPAAHSVPDAVPAARRGLDAAPAASRGGARRFCDEAPCVFDIGHNTGQDTYDHLQSGQPNLRVVAVDANPLLIAKSRTRFADAVRASRLRLINAGLVKNSALPPTSDRQQLSAQLQQQQQQQQPSGEGNLTFWVNEKQDKFSSFDERQGCRTIYDVPTERGDPERACHEVRIPTTTCASLLREYGTPVYLKVDIEGLDVVCLDTLFELPLSQRPKYVSLENVWAGMIFDLVDMGYTRFKVVDQYNVSVGRPKELLGGSGPWGEQAIDCQRGYYWSTAREVIDRIPSLPNSTKGWDGKDAHIWYDLHGRRETE